MNAREDKYGDVLGNVWRKLFKLHELFEIVCQSNDPEFAQVLNRIQEGNHTQHDVVQIRALASINTSWPEEYITIHY